MASETTNFEIGKPELNNTTNIPIMAEAIDEFEQIVSGITSFSVASGDVTLTRSQYINGILKATGAPGAARNVILPDGLTGKWVAVNATTGGQTITFKTESGTGVDVPASGAVKIYSDGVNMSVVTVPVGSLPTAIPATSIADGSVDNTEFELLGTATSSNTVNTIVKRDASARFRAADPSHANDVATKNYVDLLLTGVFSFQNDLDASTNPNYPSASKGHAYIVTVAGKVGGASGKSVDIGDLIVAKANNAGGTEASVGTSWFVVEHNLVGALLAANNLSDLASAATALTNLGLQTTTTLIEAIVKRLQESSGPTTLAMGAVADGEYLKRSGSSIVGAAVSGGGAFVEIFEVVLGSTLAAMDFNAIPSTYKHLRIIVMGRTTQAVNESVINMRFNLDSGLNYDREAVSFEGTTVTAGLGFAQNAAYCGVLAGSSAGTDMAGHTIIDIPYYKQTTFHKNYSAAGVCKFNNTSGNIVTMRRWGGSWRNAAAITDISILASSGLFTVGTRAVLYGLG